MTKSRGNEILISRDILESEMHNSSVFAKEEKLSSTKVASAFSSAKSKAFTVNFNAKVDEKSVAE